MNKINFKNNFEPAINGVNLNQMQENIEGAINNSIGAENYDNTATYAVGDFCIHGNKIYRCTTAISTAEAWTSAHWSEVTFLDNTLIILEEEEIVK